MQSDKRETCLFIGGQADGRWGFVPKGEKFCQVGSERYHKEKVRGRKRRAHTVFVIDSIKHQELKTMTSRILWAFCEMDLIQSFKQAQTA